MARIGSMAAPLVRMSGEFFPPLPLIIYGTAPILSGIVTCFLPETRNAPLPETIEQVERGWVPNGFLQMWETTERERYDLNPSFQLYPVAKC